MQTSPSTPNQPWLVITTIHAPSPAIARIAQLVARQHWRCVVVGDRKTPAGWAAPGIDYLSYDDQLARFGALASALPANHYCRKNLGYLYAIQAGADLILETDDDNLPGDTFGQALNARVTGRRVGGTRWANVYRHFSEALIWPRGNPLDHVHEGGRLLGEDTAYAPIQQFLADGDPDVDAIYRLLFRAPLQFQPNAPVLLEEGTWCAFNSQNTVFLPEAFPLLYLPSHVSFRMTDIWRSFVAQLGLWSAGHRLAFLAPTVVQERNVHLLMRDFADEVDGYLHNDAIAQTLLDLLPGCRGAPLADVARRGWQALQTLGLLDERDLALHAAWLAQLG